MPTRPKSTQPITTANMPAKTNTMKRKTLTTEPTPDAAPAEASPDAALAEAPPDAALAEAPPDAALAEAPPARAAPPKAKRAKKVKAVPMQPEMDTDAESTVADTVISDATTTATTANKKKRASKKKKKTTSSRTPSSYVLFSMEHRKKIVELSPDLSLGDVSKQCGTAWKALSETEKQPWIDKAGELKKQRLMEIEEIMKNEPPKKKRTPSSYLLFAMEHRKVVLSTKADMSIGEVSKMCGAAWKGLDDAGKQVWKDKAAALKDSAPVSVA